MAAITTLWARWRAFSKHSRPRLAAASACLALSSAALALDPACFMAVTAWRIRSRLAREGKPLREATGTWNLVGTRLTLAYQHVPGQPRITKANPEIVVNAWYGRSIELKNTGSATPIILRKRTALRQK